MSEPTEIINESSAAPAFRLPVCPVCGRYCEGDLHPIDALHESLHPIVRSNASTAKATHLCRHCVEIFTRAQRQIESHAAIFEQNNFVLPTPLRMEADERFRGRAVTMAFLDSGFYAHPDLTQPAIALLPTTAFPGIRRSDFLETNDVASWHGMMTSVVAAGNGELSKASGHCVEANLVLVKIGAPGASAKRRSRKASSGS
jgi:serine protease AprX